MEYPFTNFIEFLAWAGTPAGLMMLGSMVSVLLRDMDWWNSLSKARKQFLLTLICVFVLPVVFVYLPQQLSPDALRTVEPLFDAILMGGLAYGSSQATHEYWNTKVERRRVENKIGMALIEPQPAS